MCRTPKWYWLYKFQGCNRLPGIYLPIIEVSPLVFKSYFYILANDQKI